MKTCIALTIALAAMISPLLGESTNIPMTQNVHRLELAEYLNHHIKSLVIRGDVALLKTDGDVFQATHIGKKLAGFTDTFSLRSFGDIFDSEYGSHSLTERTSSTFHLVKVSPSQIEIGYRLFTFTNGSLKLDQGNITLPSIAAR